MTAASNMQMWFGGLSVVNLGVALAVAMAIAVVTLTLSARPRLDHKARAISEICPKVGDDLGQAAV